MENSMEKKKKKKNILEEYEEAELRRGPWTLEEDTLLTNFILHNGEGRWNLVAKSAGLKRTGKSCRLRWLNYLKSDIRRGNLTHQEQLLILELQSKWGNRWSKIAQYLPGRTDNEIKNYWRTRVEKQARQLNIESNSHSFLDTVRSFWVPRLIEKMEQNSSTSTNNNSVTSHYSNPLPCQSHASMILPTDNDSTPVLNTAPQFMDVSTNDSIYFREGNDQYLLGVDDYISMPTECHVADGYAAYEDLTLDPMWNMDDIWHIRN